MKRLLRGFAYRSGLLQLIHRIRNRRTLTVFMFHRVLPQDSHEFSFSEREFTFSVSGFRKCLDFVAENYKVVSHQAVRDHQLRRASLPERAALITFDDGWRDTLQYALPELEARSLPSVVFLATEVIELAEKRWWQDMLVEVLTQDNGLDFIEKKLSLAVNPKDPRNERVRRATAAVGALDDFARHEVLREKAIAPPMERQMFAESDLRLVPSSCSIAGHGHSHVPLPYHADSLADLKLSRAMLMRHKLDDWAMSLPHGAHDSKVFDNVRTAGFSCCYTSEASLQGLSAPWTENVQIGRIHIPENQWTCDQGGVSHAKLATFLFFRPIAR
jgi:peptidoglycan/xylan/chitin deacetylase (PgdA/CDA1 family)